MNFQALIFLVALLTWTGITVIPMVIDGTSDAAEWTIENIKKDAPTEFSAKIIDNPYYKR